MKRIPKRGAEEARRRFPALVEEAARGKPTIITRHGKPYAALVPVSYLSRSAKRTDITSLRGSGKGLWGRSVEDAVNAMRDEWRRR